jgi:hypothetical protein
MLISGSKKIIFIHNQKTGGASVRDYLEQHTADTRYLLPNHAYAIDGIEKLGRNVWDEYYSFGFVRNPWSRLVSWYTMIINPPQDVADKADINLENDLWKYVTEKSSDFEEFIENCTDTIMENRNGFLYKKSFTKNQIDYFTDENNKIAVSFIGRYENLKKDFQEVKKYLDLTEFDLPHLNPTQKKNYREYYNEHTKGLVAKRFKKDIEHFGYTFD